MPVPMGTEVYNTDAAPVIARGVEYTSAELGTAIKERVAAIIRDDDVEAGQMLARCAETEFGLKRVTSILSAKASPEDWRVGEALAEAYLTDHCHCQFPWPGGRDLKNSSSSPAGTDLVGFQETARGHRFAFGEVKTSYQAEWPPSVVTGRHGLSEQVMTLRDSESTKDELVKYLGHHAVRADWRPQFESAAEVYIADSSDVSLFGMLIRDVEPKQLDLRSRARALARDAQRRHPSS